MSDPVPTPTSTIWIVALVAALLLAVTPTALGDHDPAYQDTSGPLALDDVANDGYIVSASRAADGFDVQVLHATGSGLAAGDVPLREPGGNAGAWLHDSSDPAAGTHPDQTVFLSEDGETMHVRGINASGPHAVVFVVPIDIDEGQQWVAGFYNDAKFWLPHDSLDATFTPVFV